MSESVRQVQRPTAASDAELLAATARRERDAFLLLYDRFSPRLLGLIEGVVRDRHLAEDVLQRVMLDVWERHAARYQPVLGAVDAWLLRLAKARAIDLVRSRQRYRNEADVDSAEPTLTPQVASGLDERLAPELHAAVRELPREEREPIELAFWRGLSREEIASQLNIPIGTVKTRIRRGVMRLRDALELQGVSLEGVGAL